MRADIKIWGVWGISAAILLALAIWAGYVRGEKVDVANKDEALRKEVEEKIACGKEDDIIKELKGRGFQHLLTAHPIEDHKLSQQVWAFSDELAFTIEHDDHPDVMCLFNRYNDVTYNPVTIKSIWEAYQNRKPDQQEHKHMPQAEKEQPL